MKFESTYIPPKDYKKQREKLDKTEFETSLQCFKDHNGFRPGELHVIIAPKGGGKSTLARTIISDITYSPKKALVYLSEETKDNYFFPIRENLNRLYGSDESKIEAHMCKDTVVSELKNVYDESTLKKWCDDFLYAVDESNCDIIIFDNYSTSFLGEIHINKQSKMFRWFKQIAEDRKIPIIVFIHTGKGKNRGMFDGDSVKGSSTSVNLGSYNYMLLSVGSGPERRSFIWVEKSRYHDKAHSKAYELKYQPMLKVFYEANPLTLTDLYEVMRNV